MEVITGYHNVIVVSSMDTLSRIAIPHYNCFYYVKSANGNTLLKITALTSPTTKTPKIQKTQIIVDKPQ